MSGQMKSSAALPFSSNAPLVLSMPTCCENTAVVDPWHLGRRRSEYFAPATPALCSLLVWPALVRSYPLLMALEPADFKFPAKLNPAKPLLRWLLVRSGAATATQCARTRGLPKAGILLATSLKR